MTACVLASVEAVAAVAPPAAAPTDTLYVTDGDAARLAIVTGGTTTANPVTTHVRGYPLAVRRNSVWIAGYGTTDPYAYEYNAKGVATGNKAVYTQVLGVDGASNGTTNYILGNSAFSPNATVYSANADWTNQVPMFAVAGTDLVGITYDTVNGSLWVSDTNNIYEYSLAGALLNQFAHAGFRGCLAYEQSSDTLWYIRNGSDIIDQYDKTGVWLASTTITGLLSNNWGAEFAPPKVAIATYSGGCALNAEGGFDPMLPLLTLLALGVLYRRRSSI